MRSFHIAPFVTDSALAIEAEGTILLDANDAKFAGAPLAQITSLYPRIDFVFRSHSSANPRANFHTIDAPDELGDDDNEHYLRAFSLFVAALRPRFAIPFASNSCLLHDDTFAMNALAQTPFAVRDHFEAFARDRGLSTQLQIMIPGDRWDSAMGFDLQQHDWFDRRDQHLADYRARVAPSLARQDALEAKVSVPLKLVERFFARLAADVPGLLLAKLKGRELLLVARSARATQGFAVDLHGGGTVREIAEPDFAAFDMRIDFPSLILRQALTSNMFEHAGISKRVHYHATRAAMPALKRFVAILQMAEAELFPLSAHFSRRTMRALLPRWREGLLYARVLVDLARGGNLPDLEERYLERAAPRLPPSALPASALPAPALSA